MCASSCCRCSSCTALTRQRKEGRAKWWTASTWPSSCSEKIRRPSGRSPRSVWTSPTPGRTTATSCCSPRIGSSSKYQWDVRWLFNNTHTSDLVVHPVTVRLCVYSYFIWNGDTAICCSEILKTEMYFLCDSKKDVFRALWILNHNISLWLKNSWKFRMSWSIYLNPRVHSIFAYSNMWTLRWL